MLSILCVRLTIKVKVGIPESVKVGWYPPKKLGRVTLKPPTIPFGIVASAFSDNLSRNSCILITF